MLLRDTDGAFIWAKRLYVSGPMTGKPAHNFPAFRQATKALRLAGYMVFDPSENCAGDISLPLEQYMRQDLAMLLQADGVAVLAGWTDSPGARLEVQVADAIRLRVRPVENWLSLAKVSKDEENWR